MENEWKVDKFGQRYRETAPGLREYEMTITLSGGIEIPVSQLDEYHRRQKEADDKRRQAALEESKNRPEPKSCPFVNGCNSLCKREKCKIFLDGKCSLAIIADATGAEIEEAPPLDFNTWLLERYDSYCGPQPSAPLYGCAMEFVAADGSVLHTFYGFSSEMGDAAKADEYRTKAHGPDLLLPEESRKRWKSIPFHARVDARIHELYRNH